MDNHSEKLKSIMDACREALGINYSLLMHKHYKNYLIAIEAKDAKAASESASMIAEVLQRQQMYELHQQLCESLINDVLQVGFVPALTDVYRQLALTYDILAEYEKANDVYEKCFTLLKGFSDADDSKVTWYIATLWYNKAQQLRNKETEEDLLTHTQKALAYYESINDRHGISLCLNRIATLYPEEQFDEKIATLKRIVELNKLEGGAPAAIGMAEINIGFYEIKKGNCEFGVKLMQEAVKVIEHYTNERYAALAHMHYANGLLLAHHPHEAMIACDYADKIFKAHHIAKHYDEVETLKAEIEAQLESQE